MTSIAPTVLLYDEDCGFCRWSLDKILAWDTSKRLRAVPIQSDEGGRLLAAVDPDARHDSWHLVRPDGELFSAGGAAEPLLRLLPGANALAVIVGAFPGATQRAYRYVAAHRERWARLLGVDADCELRR